MRTYDDESLIFETYKLVPKSRVRFVGRFVPCLWVWLITKSRLLSRAWKNSSSKEALPPDFHNTRFKYMMEIMRIDDCVGEINGRHIANSFERCNVFLKNKLGGRYKKDLYGDLFFIADTMDSTEFCFSGYYNNFKRIVKKHSDKVDQYRKNYPKCNRTIFLLFDESNNYIQVSKEKDLLREDEKDLVIEGFYPHQGFNDNKFLDVIKDCKADFFIWQFVYKSIFVDERELFHPMVCIFDIKHLKKNGFDYDHNMMMKVKEEYRPR